MRKKTVAALLLVLFMALTSANPPAGARPNADTERAAAAADYVGETGDAPIKDRERNDGYAEKTSKGGFLSDRGNGQEKGVKDDPMEIGDGPAHQTDPTPPVIPTPEPEPPTFFEEYGPYIVTAEGALVLAVLGMLLMLKSSLSQNVETLGGRLEKLEEQANHPAESLKNDSSTEIAALMERIAALEKDKLSLERRVSESGNVQKESANVQTDTFHRSTNTGANQNTTSQKVFAEKRSTLSPGGAISSGDKLEQIADEFNAMVARAANAGMGVVDVKREFVQKYGVIAFKCVNYHDRMSDSGLPPQFAVDDPLAGKNLWGIPINNEYLAVVPNMPDYEKNAHFKGGMKELFNSAYSDGRYKIKVKRPAIVKRSNFGIEIPGELELY